MSLVIQKAAFFNEDYANRFAWYVDEAGPDVAYRFQVALDQTLNKLAARPDLGRLRHFKNPRLKGLRSFRMERPFHRILIFYRVSDDALRVIRLIHGARNLPRRLIEPPE